MKDRSVFTGLLMTRLVAVLALAVALGSTACTDDFSPTEPISISTARVRSGSTDTNTTQTGRTKRLVPARQRTVGTHGLVTGQLSSPVRVVRGTIARSGGSISITNTAGDASHTLRVPPGAVATPTLFEMTLAEDGTIAVDLRATEVESGRRITRFRKALSLSLSFAQAELGEVNAIHMVHVVDGEIVEFVDSRVHARRKVVVGTIRHFSRYAVACE